MNSVLDLARIAPGFADPVTESQAVFRQAAMALSMPGKVQVLPARLAPIGSIPPAALALLLCLLDHESAVHLQDTPEELGEWLRFHSGCRLTADPAGADFILLGPAAPWPDLARLKLGSEYSPERSATIIRVTQSWRSGLARVWTGPGIQTVREVALEEIDEVFASQWRALRAQFPRGVDVFFAHGDELMGLPRTTRLGD